MLVQDLASVCAKGTFSWCRQTMNNEHCLHLLTGKHPEDCGNRGNWGRIPVTTHGVTGEAFGKDISIRHSFTFTIDRLIVVLIGLIDLCLSVFVSCQIKPKPAPRAALPAPSSASSTGSTEMSSPTIDDHQNNSIVSLSFTFFTTSTIISTTTTTTTNIIITPTKSSKTTSNKKRHIEQMHKSLVSSFGFDIGIDQVHH